MTNTTVQAVKIEIIATAGKTAPKSFKSLVNGWFKSYFDRKIAHADKMENLNTKPFDGIL